MIKRNYVINFSWSEFFQLTRRAIAIANTKFSNSLKNKFVVRFELKIHCFAFEINSFCQKSEVTKKKKKTVSKISP